MSSTGGENGWELIKQGLSPMLNVFLTIMFSLGLMIIPPLGLAALYGVLISVIDINGILCFLSKAGSDECIACKQGNN